MNRLKLFIRKTLISFLSIMWKMGLIPIRSDMGGGKGKTISRYFVECFIQDQRRILSGDILEIGRNVYKKYVPVENIQSYTCLDIEKYLDIDIVADIQNMPGVPDESYDSIICTQVLEHVPNPFLAINELHRVLKPGGRLFLTVPFLNNLHMVPHDYWRFTEFTLRELLQAFQDAKVQKYGNIYYHILATLGVTSDEVDMETSISKIETQFPVIIVANAKK